MSSSSLVCGYSKPETIDLNKTLEVKTFVVIQICSFNSSFAYMLEQT